MLNHISGHKGGIAGIYNRATYSAEKAQALARWDEHIASVWEGVMIAKRLDRKLHKSWRHDGGDGPAIEGLTIEMDAEDIEECRQAATLVYAAICSRHGAAIANEIFSQQLVRKRQGADHKNYLLLNTALQRLSRSTSMSIDQVAAELAKENDTMPPESHELRWGPTGTTSPSTMAKQIHRLMKNTDTFSDYEDLIKKYGPP